MLKLFLNLLFPKTCLGCNTFGLYICASCQKKLIYQEKSICLYCEQESMLGVTHPLCRIASGVDQLITVFCYNRALKRVIAGIKYHLIYDAFKELFTLMDAKYGSYIPILEDQKVYIQPIPLHAKRLAQRGFNQSEYIAHWLVKKVNGKMIHSLERVKETQAQAKLGKTERIQNTASAFEVKKGVDVHGLAILLVDDVVTTGSTVRAAASALKKAGAAWVGAFSVAKD